MKRSYINILLSTAIAFLSLCLTASCGSSRKMAHDPIYDSGKHAPKSKTNKKKPDKHDQSHTGSELFPIIDRSDALLNEATKWLGTRYVYGGHSMSGTDCSGFVMEVYRKAADIKLPRTTTDQRDFCNNVNFNRMQAGDLIFFTSRNGRGKVSHVGIYIGDGKMIHASSSRGVIVSDLNERYYVTNYHSSGRVAKYKPKKIKVPQPQIIAPVKQAHEISIEQLDDILSHKADSIYSDIFD